MPLSFNVIINEIYLYFFLFFKAIYFLYFTHLGPYTLLDAFYVFENYILAYMAFALLQLILY